MKIFYPNYYPKIQENIKRHTGTKNLLSYMLKGPQLKAVEVLQFFLLMIPIFFFTAPLHPRFTTRGGSEKVVFSNGPHYHVASSLCFAAPHAYTTYRSLPPLKTTSLLISLPLSLPDTSSTPIPPCLLAIAPNKTFPEKLHLTI